MCSNLRPDETLNFAPALEYCREVVLWNRHLIPRNLRGTLEGILGDRGWLQVFGQRLLEGPVAWYRETVLLSKPQSWEDTFGLEFSNFLQWRLQNASNCFSYLTSRGGLPTSPFCVRWVRAIVWGGAKWPWRGLIRYPQNAFMILFLLRTNSFRTVNWFTLKMLKMPGINLSFISLYP